MSDESESEIPLTGPIAWFAQNGVAAKMMILVIFIGGVMATFTIKKEVFPEFSSERITVSVVYRGAAPQEVENAVSVRIEEALQGIEGIDRVRSASAEGVSGVTIELIPGTDPAGVIDDVKAAVDAIDTFPNEAEKPIITELVIKSQVINIAVSGNADETTLKRLGEKVRDEVSHLPGITQAELVVARPYEITIEISEADLRRYELTFDEIAEAVRRSSLDLPGGSIKTLGGEFLLRVKGQAYRAPEFEQIPLRTLPDGSRLLLGDVANVIDGFEDKLQFARFNNEPAVVVQVFRVGDESALEVSKIVRDYAQEATARMPEGIKITAYQDYSEYLRGRLSLLTKNAALGGVFVFIVLTLFMRLRLAIWVSIGIPISFLGTLWVVPNLDVSINMMTLFGFLIVLGIVVDDAVVVSENIYTRIQSGEDALTAGIRGAKEVSVPVIFSILTTVAAFAPMAAIEGNTGKVLRGIPLIVIPTLFFSLIESMWALPNHLSHMKKIDLNKPTRNPLTYIQNAFSRFLDAFINRVYRPTLETCLRWRYLTISAAISSVLLIVSLVATGFVKFQFFPPVEGDDIAAFLTMPTGTPPEVTRAAIASIERAALALKTEYDGKLGYTTNSLFRNVLASVGDQPYRTAQSKNGGSNGKNFTADNVGEVHVQLVPAEGRPVSSTEMVNRWRELTGPIPGAVESIFTAHLFSAGNAINIQLAGPDVDQLRKAAAELKKKLSDYEGIFDIADSHRTGKQEIKLNIRPDAEAPGLKLQDLARQVRQAFYGEEAQRIQRERDDVRVMVRYPQNERRSLHNLENMRIRLPDGTAVPFSAVAVAEIGRGYSTINRVDRQRALNITADVDLNVGNPNDIIADLRDGSYRLAIVPAGELPEEKRRLVTIERGSELRLSVFDATGKLMKSGRERDLGEQTKNIAQLKKQLAELPPGGEATKVDPDRLTQAVMEILDYQPDGFLPELLARYPGLRYELEGEQAEQTKTMGGLKRGFFLSMFIIFALLAIPLKSYFLPFVVMSAIPLGFVGAVLGHMVMGLHLTVLSMFGFVALAGVAVNDNLVLVDFINRAKRSGIPEIEAVRQAGRKRFRPILITSLSTFIGLTPLLLEKSLQAQFLIPMAASLGFGVLYSTVTSLLVVPSVYLAAGDIRNFFGWLYGRDETVANPTA
jgi:multidrug efflux pump subunit AcrB